MQLPRRVDSEYADVLDYLPYRLRTTHPHADSPNTLNVTVVELTYMDRSTEGHFSAAMGVEGQIVDKAGKSAGGFPHPRIQRQPGVGDQELPIGHGHHRVVAFKDLGKDFLHAQEVRQEVTGNSHASGLVPPPPPPEAPLDIKGRLLRLDDLLRKGLITPEEYKTHKEQILKGL